MNASARVGLLPIAVLCLSCGTRAPGPSALDTRNEACRSCRMPVSDARTAAQLVAPGQEPLFFDDIGCLRDFLARSPARRGAVAYVADHRTKAWVRASSAVYTRAAIETPMGSHWIAHADAGSRDADPVSRPGQPVAVAEIFGPAGPPDGGEGTGR
jgi:copper chaperone NosL